MQASTEIGIQKFFQDMYGQAPAVRSIRKKTTYSTLIKNSAVVTIDAQRACHVTFPDISVVPAGTKAALTTFANFLKGQENTILTIEFTTKDKVSYANLLPQDWISGVHTDTDGKHFRVWKELKKEETQSSVPSRLVHMLSLFSWK